MTDSQTPPAKPSADQLFHVVHDAYGKRLALVFGNHAERGECPFYTASRCHHCDIGMGEGVAFDLATNRRRLEWYQSYFRHEWEALTHLVIYNSGSVLNPVEMPFEFLQDILAVVRRVASIRVVSLDSRESFVTVDRILRIAEQLRDDQCVRIILGIESANDHIRNELLQKGMSFERIQRMFDDIAKAAEQIGPHRVGIDVNIVVGGPGTTSQTAAIDAVETARMALAFGRMSVDFNIHPYYPSLRGLARFPAHSRCPVSILLEAIQAVASICQAYVPAPRIFIGDHDEGHDTDRNGRLNDALRVGHVIHRFNATQDFGDMTDCLFDK
ncbi:MAG: Archaeal-type Fe-S oxidoreductase [Planctomycetaceae bacterium]|nr:Archaeal-type Fe-S oxidoreductase [Planctomycetaceae bacterium]